MNLNDFIHNRDVFSQQFNHLLSFTVRAFLHSIEFKIQHKRDLSFFRSIQGISLFALWKNTDVKLSFFCWSSNALWCIINSFHVDSNWQFFELNAFSQDPLTTFYVHINKCSMKISALYSLHVTVRRNIMRIDPMLYWRRNCYWHYITKSYVH